MGIDKPKNKTSLTNVLNHAVLCICTCLCMAPLQAQVKRDHRTKEKNTISEHKFTNNATVKSQILYFDEADALFGKRSEVKKKYPTFKFTGKVDRVILPQKLYDGENSIFKTKSGNTLQATVKKGKLTGFGTVSDGSSNTLVIAKMGNNKTCFNCTELYHYPADGRPKDCWTICEVVDCNSEHNARIHGRIAPNLKSTPSPAGPIPIPYPNVSKLDSIERL